MHSADMKQFIFSTLAIVGVFGFISCERHDWEDSANGKKDGTKNLFPKEDKKDHGKEHGDHSGHDHPAAAENSSEDSSGHDSH